MEGGVVLAWYKPMHVFGMMGGQPHCPLCLKSGHHLSALFD